MCDSKIKDWVSLVAKRQNIADFAYEICGKSGKAEGYIGDITFVTITGPKTLEIVIKSSKDSPTLRAQTPMKLTFEKEIFVYDQVLPTFRQLQKPGEDLLDFMPVCYFTHSESSGEVLVLDNLKKQGFETSDRTKVLTSEHVRLVLEAYGKWHAFSYALRERNGPAFAKLAQNNINMFSYFILEVNLAGNMWQEYDDAKNACFAQSGEILQKLDVTKQDAERIFTELFDQDPDFRVIVHGDCWNNNFMFKVEEDNKPVGVKILDWQCSGLASPVMDLSHFIYGCCDTEKHPDVDEFLEIYHRSLSSCLMSLGCSPKVFPFEKLKEHWRKFSRYGLFLQPWVIKYSICDSNEAPDFVEAAEGGKEFLDNFNIRISDKDEFYRRVKSNFLHYLRNLD
nr:PREDICTED: uncharacterized protein LOC663050 isoform X1 [Tribolium castaneum]XP_015837002.1 PREDICTED: uncharacterized protein LOC663050 isoform X2 [Tribolium castaneum]|eukprot:XP_008195442.1 PREDICTED: uncharacterized protein LOC663050 isoform X1 [Tribolium castaneum]